ncbi:penicillin acylase family protein [Corallincola platygyrae]|uniref:Penicillin acylase family protein n=1 Tax=Corallincola platygyrae TaxID=1193278 RepID=A0ABW4XL33_9GAMM
MKLAKRLLFAIGILITASLAAVYFVVSASLPTIEGEWALPGLEHSVTIERDALGVPTIQAQSENDRAFALGVLHGQDRFFQMDLLRRNAAGELSELFGEAALSWDQAMRTHRFRARATRTIAAMPEPLKQQLIAYTRGVNSGRDSLAVRPFEYLLLSQSPRPWQPEDSLLCLFSMYVDLQNHDGGYERSLAFMQKHLPADWFEFLRPQPVSQTASGLPTWEAPLAGKVTTALTLPTIPMSDLLATLSENDDDSNGDDERMALAYRWHDEGVPGSNNWGVDGSRTSHGGAIVADDMHLGIRVPNTWYRASWYLKDGRRVTGATLPGAPAMVVGSNGDVAWGFTNSYGDWSEVIQLVTDDRRSQYLTPEGWQPFTYHDETILVGQETTRFIVRDTIWGPVIGEDDEGNLLAYRWVAHDIEGANLNMLAMVHARNTEEALIVAANSGVPAQNLMLADKDGRLHWSIMGPIPQRDWQDKQWIQDWSEQSLNWTSYRSADAYPLVSSTQHNGVLWTANSQVVMDELYPLIGDGGYDIGIRAGSIAEQLKQKQQFTEQDLLDIQLSTHNRLYDFWAEHLKAVVDIQPQPPFSKAILEALAKWQGKAEVDSVSYRLVSAYHDEVLSRTLGPIAKALEDKEYEAFSVRKIDNHIDNALWLMVTEQPEHLLNPEYKTWEGLLLASAEAAYQATFVDGKGTEQAGWGQVNQLHLQHPFSKVIPGLGILLDMPKQPMAGDGKHVVRIQGESFGASQRMVVAPGREQHGIFHMPTGQSGHPLSEFYRAGHDDWVNGNPSPFLPQKTKYNLKLLPVDPN